MRVSECTGASVFSIWRSISLRFSRCWQTRLPGGDSLSVRIPSCHVRLRHPYPAAISQIHSSQWPRHPLRQYQDTLLPPVERVSGVTCECDPVVFDTFEMRFSEILLFR